MKSMVMMNVKARLDDMKLDNVAVGYIDFDDIAEMVSNAAGGLLKKVFG